MAVWTEQSKNSASWSSQSRTSPAVDLSEGVPIGLLLALTYAADVTTPGITWAGTSKNTTSWTGQTKN